MAGERQRLLADPLHQAAVTAEHVGAAIDQILVKLRREEAFGQGRADRIGETLAQGASRRLDAGSEAALGMAGGPAADFVEALQLLQRHLVISG